MTQKFINEYGSESVVSKLRQTLVNDLNILSVFNGSFAMSKQGPRSAEQRSKGIHEDVESDDKYDQILSKSKLAGVYVKHMVSEIILLLACN